MSNIWEGTHVWLWQADQVHGGNVDRMIEELKALGVTGVLIKYSDGNLIGDPVSQKFMADFKRLAPAFKAAGFVVGGWTYQYLTDVDGEVDALRQAVEAGADWIVLNGEKHIEGKSVQVAEYGRKVRQLFPNLKIGMSTYAIADYHPTVPFDAYNQFVDAWMPQMYWATIGWSVEKTFNMSKTSFEKFGKPILPTGQAYSEPPNIICRSDDMARFVQLCRDAELTHVSWWDWQHFDDEIRSGIRNNVLQVSQSGLDDIPDWAETAVNWVRKNGIMSGYPDGTFGANKQVTRAELAQALYNVLHQKKQ